MAKKNFRIFLFAPDDVGVEYEQAQEIIRDLVASYNKQDYSFELLAYRNDWQSIVVPPDCELAIFLIWSKLGPLLSTRFDSPIPPTIQNSIYENAILRAKTAPVFWLTLFRQTKNVLVSLEDSQLIQKYEDWQAATNFFSFVQKQRQETSKIIVNGYEGEVEFRQIFTETISRILGYLVENSDKNLKGMKPTLIHSLENLEKEEHLIPELIHIQAGEFLQGEVNNKRNIFLHNYYIGKYPITVKEFRDFIKSGGYDEPKWWSKDGWEFKQNHNWDKPKFWSNDKYQKEDRYPVIGVSWFEAVAYCAWLSSLSETEFRLPTEIEWEKAARGTDGRKYTWGNYWQDGLCNNEHVFTDGLTVVGEYSAIGSDSPFGCADMLGNVYEWCNSRFYDFPYQLTDGREEIDVIDARVIKGGSWLSTREYTNCIFRLFRDPWFRGNDCGFRVAALFDVNESYNYSNLEGVGQSSTNIGTNKANFEFRHPARNIEIAPPETSHYSQIRENYETLVFAVENTSGEPVGTGFFILYREKVLAVTCAHVLWEIKAGLGDSVKINPFDQESETVSARVIGMQFRKNVKPEDWTAKEDVAILEVVGLTHNIKPLQSVNPGINQVISGCWCFGYVQSRKSRGAWFKDITCENLVGQGFVQLLQSSSGPRMEKGASGAPLCYVDQSSGRIIGMVQAIYGQQTAYLIASSTIMETIEQIFSKGEYER